MGYSLTAENAKLLRPIPSGWDVFTVDYSLNGPLAVIVNQDSRETYLCIFRYSNLDQVSG